MMNNTNEFRRTYMVKPYRRSGGVVNYYAAASPEEAVWLCVPDASVVAEVRPGLYATADKEGNAELFIVLEKLT